MIVKKWFVMLISVLLTACIPVTPPIVSVETPDITVPMPDIGIPFEQLNKDIGLSVPKGWNTFHPADPITLYIGPISKKIIVVNEADKRIFLYDNKKWIELQDRMVLVDPDDSTYILDPAQDFTHYGITSIAVDIPNPKKPALLRIFIIGYIYKDGKKTDEKVASYIDVNLEPQSSPSGSNS